MDKRIFKSLICMMVSILIIGFVFPAFCLADNPIEEKAVSADNNTKKTRVVVSMGDSYSSGEGIEPYYGTKDLSSPQFSDWVAHRSRNAWGGQLYLEQKTDLLSMHKKDRYYINQPSDDYQQWYFVAVSGAETKNICGYVEESDGKFIGQRKECSNAVLLGYEDYVYYLLPQITVLNDLKKKEIVPDYITLTLGGNDLGFVDVIKTAAVYSDGIDTLNPFEPGHLTDELKKAKKKLDHKWKDEKTGEEQESVKVKLKNAYKAINDAVEDKTSNKKPCILVAGYPRLLDPNGKGLPFSKSEAEKINSNVTYFNNTIRKIVKECKEKDKLNICYVDVETRFAGHEAYSEDAWINKVILIPRREDINQKISSNPVSAASIHPNIKGATKGYAKCVQEYIDHFEKGTPLPTPLAKDINDGARAIESNLPSAPDETIPLESNHTTESSAESSAPSQSEFETTENSTSQNDTTGFKPTTKPIGKTKVTTVKKVFNDQFEGGKVTVKIPKLTIEGVNTNSINNKMSKKITKACSGKVSDGKKWYRTYRGSSFEYYIGTTYVSIIVDIEPFASDPAIYIFNISRKTGKQLSRKQMLKVLGISSKSFESRTKKAIMQFWKPLLKQAKKRNDKYALKDYKVAISKKTLRKAIPCVNSKGKKCTYLKLLPDECGQGCNDHVLTI